MNRDLGVWTSGECALVLIDYQKEMFGAIRSETDADLVELHVRWLSKTAKAFDVPIVLSTVGVEYGINSPTQPAILAELPDVEPIDRSSMNAFEDQAFREAVAATGRKRLIIGALHTEVCLTLATVEALKNGYDAQFVTDATSGNIGSGSTSALPRSADLSTRPVPEGGILSDSEMWSGIALLRETLSRARFRPGSRQPQAQFGGRPGSDALATRTATASLGARLPMQSRATQRRR